MKSLILSCGGSPEPLIFCINNFDCDFIYFLHSNKSLDIAKDIISQLNIDEDKYSLKCVDNEDSLEDCFAKSREIIKELQSEYENIHIDFTGGTKPMVSGLVLAAIGENCTYSYVGTKNLDGRDKNGLGIVQDGFEAIIDQRDPYDVFAVMEFEKGMDFFNKYQFSAAKSNFMQASEKLESPDLKELSEIYIELVELYDKWDKFNNKVSKNVTIIKVFKSILDKIHASQNIKRNFEKNYPLFISQIDDNVKFLELKLSKKGLIKPVNVSYYIPDLLNNTKRRLEEGKYDDAVARLYRTIELIGQYSLTMENVIDESNLRINSEFKISIRDIESKYNSDVDEVLSTFYEYSNAKDDGKKSFGIPLKKTYQLLEALGSDYAADYLNDKHIKSNLNSRNGSILAHGLKPVDKTKAEELYVQVFEYAKEAFPDIEKYMEMSEFPKFE